MASQKSPAKPQSRAESRLPREILSCRPELDAGHRVGDLAGDELEAPPGALVVEADAGAGVEAVRLPVVDGDVVAEDLGHPVGRAGVEGRHLRLRGLPHLAEHLRRRRLVEADLVVDAAHHPDGLEHAQHAQAGDVGGELGLAERQGHEADGAQVVDLVGLDRLHHRDQRRQVLEVAVDQLQLGRLLLHHLDLGVVLAPDHAVDVVALDTRSWAM